jgi:two-component system CheB/CheR fusion protein
MDINKYSEFLSNKPQDFLIVGLGASAGGIQALQAFFEHVPEDSNMAYVVILHLSPDHDSQLAQVLQAVTTIPVTQVREKVKVTPDHIYVVPPNQHLIMEDGFIVPSVNLYLEERRAPVDIFFRNLADSHGPRAISVILSGTGANGSMGVKRIKERGGAAYVQNPREAEFNEMPRNAIATELIDEVLPVAEIPGRILAYRNSQRAVTIPVEPEQRPEEHQQALREIFTQLRLRTGHDFSNYKRPTLLRRIERRMNVRDLPDLTSYAAFLKQHTEESGALLKDLLISVTNFFRDKKAFEALELDILPNLFRDKNAEDEVRIWIAGCATGEEAYSLAMLVAERTMGIIDAPKVQLFATDIDEAAIMVACEGLYTLNDAADVSAERLMRFFTKEGDSYRIKREIREMVLFANHNFLKDPPFSRLDLVSCRNVLIYLNSSAQERTMETFHFALKPGGFLFLGSSESVDGSGDLYATVSREHHIFQARQTSIRHYPVPVSVPSLQPRPLPAVKPGEEEKQQPNRISFGELHYQLLEQYAPPSLVVNEEYEILHMSEKVGRFLEFSGGEPTRNLLKLIRPELRLELRSALYQAMQRQTTMEARNIVWSKNGERESINIHVKPVTKDGDPAKGFILVIFEPGEQVPGEEKVVLTAGEPIARHLEEELTQMKARLRQSGEQHEYQAEELKASNEELQAMNEELRSAAEELETSKEELQSINEELRTVNQELKVKIEEISLTGNNLQNLINSADVATIFLDRALCIRLYTPAARQLFNLIPSDYGRPISDITHRLEYAHLLPDAEAVLEKLTSIEREVTTTDHRAFMMRLLPYRTAEDRINGVVITFFDITERKQAEEAMRQSEERLRLLIESAREYAIYTIDTERRVISWSNGAHLIFGYSEAEMIGKSGDIVFVPEDRKQGVPEWEVETAKKEGRAVNERWHLRKDGSRFWGSGHTQPLRDENGETIGFVQIMRDLTEQKKAQEAKFFLASIVETSNDSVITIDFQRKITSWNKAAEYLYGYTAQEAIGKNLTMLTHPEDFSIIVNYVDAIEQSREVAVFDTVRHKKDGHPIHLEIVMSPVLDTSGEIIGISTIARDVSERKRREANLAFLAKINLDFAPLLTVPKVMEPVGQQLTNYLQLSGCLFSLVDEENDQVEVIYEYRPDESLPSRMGFHHLAETFTEKGRRHFHAGKPAVISTAADSPMVQDSLHALITLDLGSRVDVPHLEGGRWRFLLTVGRAEAGEWRRDELELLEELAAKIYIRIERAKAEEALRDSEARLQLALSAADLGTFTWHVAEDRTEADARALAHFGLPADTKVTLAEALATFHPEDGPKYIAAVQSATDPSGPGTLHLEFRIRRSDSERWMSIIAKTLFAGNPTAATWMSGVLADITERKKAEEVLRQSEERTTHLLLLADTLRSINDPLQVLEEGLKSVGEYLNLDRVVYNEIDPEVTTYTTRVNYLKPGFSSVLGSLPMEPFKEMVRDLQKGITYIQPDVERDSKLTEAEKQACRSIKVGAFVTLPLIKNNQWVCNLVAHSGKPRNWAAHELAIMKEAADRIWSAFERAKAEQALRVSEERLQLATTAGKIGTYMYYPVEDRSEPDEQMLSLFGLPPHGTLNLAESMAHIIHEDDRERHVKEVMAAIDPAGNGRLDTDFRVVHPDGSLHWLHVTAQVYFEGNPPQPIKMPGVAIDITDRKEAEEALRKSEEEFRLLITATSDSVYKMSADWKQMYNLEGKSYLADTSHAKNSWMEDYIPDHERERVTKAIEKAIENKAIFELEHQVFDANGAIGWVYSRAIPVLNAKGDIREWFGAWSNITTRKRAEEQLKEFTTLLEKQVAERTQALRESRDILKSIFDTTLLGLAVLKAVRDEKSNITDFQILLVNKELERETGRTDMVGKLYSVEFPGIKQVGLFDIMLKVMDTGEPSQIEYYFPHQNLNKWYASMFVKLEDGLVATNLDITERKKAEEQLLKNYQTLKQSEEVACLGSWEYDLASGTFYWSEGMYRLFDLPLGSPVHLESYLAYVIDEDKPIAQNLISAIREGKGPLKETLRIQVRGEVLSLKIQAIVLYNEAQQATRMLGVDVDISEMKRLESENLTMRLEQQKKLMNAILEAQEEEKRRTSESLHNGVGQILYATKLHLDLVEVEPLPDKKESVKQALATSQELLISAIKETRRVSHEMVPILLKDFGLEVAIKDFCKYLQADSIQLHCHIEGIGQLGPYLEIALFRISQELVNNILKHAEASEASLLLRKTDGKILLQASDNGKGFEADKLTKQRGKEASNGLGLPSIQDRVKLLNGTFRIQSKPGKGTTITIHLPVEGS